MRLSQMVASLDSCRVFGEQEIEIDAIAYDSRSVSPGTLFVAVPTVGGAADTGGHRFIEQARQRGASAVVVQTDSPLDGITRVQVPDSRAALGSLAAEFYRHPSRRLKLYAVTGTDGKTTTTYLLEQIFRHAGMRTGMLGTVLTRIGEQVEHNVDRMTTPESLDLQRHLRTMVDAGVTHAAIEASSHSLALERLRGCSFAACAITNITSDHVEFHGSWQAYFEAKARLFTGLAPDQPAILNVDDSSYEALSRVIKGPIVTYGMTSEAEVRATSLEPGGRATRFLLCHASREQPVDLRLVGTFNISNALAAASLALSDGLPLDAVADGLSAAEAPPGRMQRVEAGQPFEIVVDYAHTVHAFETTLATLRGRAGPNSHLIAVFGAAGNRDRQKRPVLAQLARQYTDFFIVTNEDPFDEDAHHILDEIISGVSPEDEGIRYMCEFDRQHAIERAVERARPGDTLVILGKGHERSIVAGAVRLPWSDVAAVERALGVNAR
ncbi:MAG TPA: UDP-N-acetylmuramoyl-L-alanyl-D-glutamate--2,6-diaminopimelate ligase [Chloroflexota bacterium]